VAIKHIKDGCDSFYSAKKILREILILAKLTEMKSNHHTTKLKRVFIPDSALKDVGHLFLVMEDGGVDLKRCLDHAEKVKFDEPDAIKLIYELLCSLHFLHTAGVIHRDIKPTNILLDGNLKLRLCDLGLARTIDDPVGRGGSGKSSAEIGKELLKTREERGKKERRLSNHIVSRWYRPPEVILMETEYDGAIDLWSSGCILAEMMACCEDYRKAGIDLDERYIF
jgi:mitogen-activated protein kinase 1/3